MKTTVRLLALAMLTGLLAAGSTTAADKAPAKDNTAPEGFTLLFNGKDLTNWHAVIPPNVRSKMAPADQTEAQKEANEDIFPHWTIVDGAIYHDGKRTKYGYNLGSWKEYGDFELYLDWKIEKKGDSGLYLRGTPQVQIWDSENLGKGLEDDLNKGSGGLWNNAKGSKGKQPLKKADKPVGEWNTFHIVMKGDKVTIHLNGVLVIDEAPLEPYWDKKAPLPAMGPVELQHHGDKLWFKNIYVKELK